jgi:hypothetical protein
MRISTRAWWWNRFLFLRGTRQKSNRIKTWIISRQMLFIMARKTTSSSINMLTPVSRKERTDSRSIVNPDTVHPAGIASIYVYTTRWYILWYVFFSFFVFVFCFRNSSNVRFNVNRDVLSRFSPSAYSYIAFPTSPHRRGNLAFD